jgi:hypothetical protein
MLLRAIVAVVGLDARAEVAGASRDTSRDA